VAHVYGILEQADLVEAVWAGLGVASTHLVVHDYSSSIGQELVSRGTAARLDSITYLNGGIYPYLHRPTEAQQLLRGPDGDEFARAIDAGLFASSVRATFGSGHPVPDEVVDDMWSTVSMTVASGWRPACSTTSTTGPSTATGGSRRWSTPGSRVRSSGARGSGEWSPRARRSPEPDARGAGLRARGCRTLAHAGGPGFGDGGDQGDDRGLTGLTPRGRGCRRWPARVDRGP